MRRRPPPRLLHRPNTVLLNSEFHLMRSFFTVTRLISAHSHVECREPMLISRREPLCDFLLLINRAVIGRLARIPPKISNMVSVISCKTGPINRLIGEANT